MFWWRCCQADDVDMPVLPCIAKADDEEPMLMPMVTSCCQKNLV
jgi:hypothetical protein